MTQLQEAPQDIIETFLPTILENEAKGILSDLLVQPALAMHFMGSSEAQTVRTISHVVGILEECYRAGHLKIAASQQDGRLYGYAMFFVHPDPSMSLYCHKIFVFEPYRGHGLGKQLLSGVLHYSQGTCLLCRHDLVPFYERSGMEYKGDFTPPTAQQGFALTRDMYAGLAIMGSPGGDGASPVFMLNDEDIKQLIAI
ncbi:GNAT family N-acetyltransferase [Pseudomonas sp. ITA]|uniref:GNAT family N-acetyltransferase n=1 Tax=Pseudomonas sp. ITA TaxID=2825841 RepID=UPI0024974711|nr:GNAT family N-acetyltransferase [Pseudomonas sp. ITA]MDI2145047.1 GNAT family N-acetyltransferase [Pseudomonas sp. ITA]